MSLGRNNFSTYGSGAPGGGSGDLLRGYNLNTPEYRKANVLRSSNKGPVQKASTRGGGPEHIYRDPRVKLRAAQLSRDCVTVDYPTRSTIKKMADRNPYTASVSALLSYAAKQCKETVDRIVAECKSKNKKFFDKSFYFDSRMSMYPPGSPDDCTVTEPTNVARLYELFPSYPLYCEGVSSGDIVQGAVGDCFFIGAVSALGSTTATQVMDPIGRLFAAYDFEVGIYGVLFCKNGGWEWVIVDDIIATYEDGKSPLYATAASSEIWPMIIEKAYAKVHYCWDTIDGGWGREALADLTGGIEYTVDLRSTHSKMTFDEFRVWVDDPLTILGCAVGQHVQEQGGAGRAGESGAVFGLFKGHAYSVIKAAKTSDGVGFVRVRNPWGNEAEWTGPYADNAPEWKRRPLHMKELQPEFKADGAFWMTWDDFKKYFTDIDLCTFFASDNKCVTIFGTSKGNSFLKPDNTYILEVKSKKPKAKIIATLGQEDPKSQPDHKAAKSLPYAVLRLSMYQLTTLPKTYTEMSKCLGWKVETAKKYNRQVDETKELEPGLYSLVPQLTEGPAGIGHYIRCFCDEDDDISIYRYDDKAGTFLTTETGAGRSAPAPAPASGGGAAAKPVAPAPASNGGGAAKPVAPAPAVTPAYVPAPAAKPAAMKIEMDFNELFSAEGGIGLAACNAFARADTWGRGTIDKKSADTAFGYLLMSSDIGRQFRKAVLSAPTYNVTLQNFTQLSDMAIREALSNVQNGEFLTMEILFESEGGLETATARAFTRADTWNRGTLTKRAAETAFHQLLMSSDIGREFSNTLNRTSVFQLTQNQFAKVCERAFLDGTQ